MPSKFAKTILFLSSYAPLLLLLTLQNLEKHADKFWVWIPAGIGVISFLGLWLFLKWVRGSAERKEEVACIERKDSEVLAYIVTYVFPFLSIDFSNLWNVISLAFFFIVLMFIYINSNMIHVNPMLSVFGYNIYEVQTPKGTLHTILTKRSRLLKSTTLNVVMIGDDIFMEK